MSNNDPCSFLESSFLRPLLLTPGVTDISYNGRDIFYESKSKGRQKSAIVAGVEQVGAFLRQIANLSERQFSYSNPILDVSFSRYRLNAVHSSLTRASNNKTYSFSLRLASPSSAIADNSAFFDGKSEEILLKAIRQHESIVIGGGTGVGKTELEKWILLHLPFDCRVIVIDNVEELDLVSNPHIDMTTWIVNQSVSFPSLIRNALRNNPDYIVVAEARGEEMLDALISAMSGHPIIISIHAKDIESLPERMVRLAMLSSDRLDRESLLDDITHHIRYYAYLEKKTLEDGSVGRFLESIGKIDEGEEKMRILYRRKNL